MIFAGGKAATGSYWPLTFYRNELWLGLDIGAYSVILQTDPCSEVTRCTGNSPLWIYIYCGPSTWLPISLKEAPKTLEHPQGPTWFPTPGFPVPSSLWPNHAGLFAVPQTHMPLDHPSPKRLLRVTPSPLGQLLQVPPLTKALPGQASSCLPFLLHCTPLRPALSSSVGS